MLSLCGIFEGDLQETQLSVKPKPSILVREDSLLGSTIHFCISPGYHFHIRLEHAESNDMEPISADDDDITSNRNPSLLSSSTNNIMPPDVEFVDIQIDEI